MLDVFKLDKWIVMWYLWARKFCGRNCVKSTWSGDFSKAHSSRPLHEPLTPLTAAKLGLLWIQHPFECACKCMRFLCCTQTLRLQMYGIPVLYPDIACANVQDSRLYQITFGYITGTLCICTSIQTDIKSTVNLALLHWGSLASAGGHGVGMEVYQHSCSSFWPFVHG